MLFPDDFRSAVLGFAVLDGPSWKVSYTSGGLLAVLDLITRRANSVDNKSLAATINDLSFIHR